MAGRRSRGKKAPDTPQDTIGAELKQLHGAARRVLIDMPIGETVAGRKARADQEHQVWSLYSLMLQESGDVDGAAKASAQAVKHAELAVKLVKSSLADRVLDLERVVAQAKQVGAGVRQEARRRRKK